MFRLWSSQVLVSLDERDWLIHVAYIGLSLRVVGEVSGTLLNKSRTIKLDLIRVKWGRIFQKQLVDVLLISNMKAVTNSHRFPHTLSCFTWSLSSFYFGQLILVRSPQFQKRNCWVPSSNIDLNHHNWVSRSRPNWATSNTVSPQDHECVGGCAEQPKSQPTNHCPTTPRWQYLPGWIK